MQCKKTPVTLILGVPKAYSIVSDKTAHGSLEIFHFNTFVPNELRLPLSDTVVPLNLFNLTRTSSESLNNAIQEKHERKMI